MGFLKWCLAEHNRRFMMLHFTKRIATAGFLAGLIILLAPQSAAAMTIQERLVTLKTYFQERGLLFGGFRAPFLLNVAYADDNENENEKERELLLFQETQAAAINRYMQNRNMPLATGHLWWQKQMSTTLIGGYCRRLLSANQAVESFHAATIRLGGLRAE